MYSLTNKELLNADMLKDGLLGLSTGVCGLLLGAFFSDQRKLLFAPDKGSPSTTTEGSYHTCMQLYSLLYKKNKSLSIQKVYILI